MEAPVQSTEAEPKKASSKQTKAQKRAAQAEFNRQLWAEAYVVQPLPASRPEG